MNIIKNWLFNSGQSIRNINLSRKHADVSRGAFRVKRAFRAKGYRACKSVRDIYFNYLNIVDSLQIGVAIFKTHCNFSVMGIFLYNGNVFKIIVCSHRQIGKKTSFNKIECILIKLTSFLRVLPLWFFFTRVIASSFSMSRSIKLFSL